MGEEVDSREPRTEVVGQGAFLGTGGTPRPRSLLHEHGVQDKAGCSAGSPVLGSLGACPGPHRIQEQGWGWGEALAVH